MLFNVLFLLASIPLDALLMQREAARVRMDTSSCHLQIDLKVALTNADTNELYPIDSKVHRHEVYEWWMSGTSSRLDSDVHWIDTNLPDGTIATPVVGQQPRRKTKLILTESTYTTLNTTEFSQQSALAGKIGPRAMALETMNVIPDFRLLGICPDSFSLLYRSKIEDLLGAPDRLEPVVTEVDYQGMRAVLSQYKRANGQTRSFWILPDSGYCVARVEYNTPVGEGTRTVTLESELKKYPSDVWFPSKVERKVTKNGVLIGHEVVTITNAEFNHEIPARIFTLEGFEPPEGTIFQDFTTANAGHIVFKAGDSKPFVPTAPPPPKARPETADMRRGRSARKWFVIVNAIFALGCFVVLLYRKYRQRNSGNTKDG